METKTKYWLNEFVVGSGLSSGGAVMVVGILESKWWLFPLGVVFYICGVIAYRQNMAMAMKGKLKEMNLK